MYSRTVLDHFANPRNVGVIEDADGYARVESQVHSDLIDLYIQVKEGRITRVRYRVQGCVAAIASSSMTSQLAMGLPLDGAAKLTAEQVVAALGGLPESKRHCSVLAPSALRQAVEDYLRNHPKVSPRSISRVGLAVSQT
jgi:nitrogen fixation NifU-like protein